MLQTPLQKNGCFQVTYPDMNWQEVPCTTAPTYPQLPLSNSTNKSVGNFNSYAAQVPGTISSTTGSFDSVTGLTSETGNKFSSDCSSYIPDVRNTFTLQLNTNVFSTTVSGCDQHPGCKGWQQFVYSNSGKLYIQNWLIDYGPPCPKDWTSFGDDCYSGSSATSVPAQAIENLAQLSLTANVTGTMNTVILSIRNNKYWATDQLSAISQDNVLGLAQDWDTAEFNLFGDGCSSQANFNAGTTIQVRLNIASNPMSVPTCLSTGFTEETNNLDLRSCSSFGAAGTPAGIMFIEDNNNTRMSTGLAARGR
ncbi:MAG TPA: hypothetical protein VF831_07980 [Anaerolineales bacterium]